MICLNAEILRDVVVQVDVLDLKVPNLSAKQFTNKTLVHDEIDLILISTTSNDLELT